MRCSTCQAACPCFPALLHCCQPEPLPVQAGKLHFGVVLGWSVVGSMGVWFVVNNKAGTLLP